MGRGNSGRDENAGRSRSRESVIRFANVTFTGLDLTIEAIPESCSRAEGTTFSAIRGARLWGSWKMLAIAFIYRNRSGNIDGIRSENQITYRLKIKSVSEQYLRTLEDVCLPGKGISSISSAQDPKSNSEPCQPIPTPPSIFAKPLTLISQEVPEGHLLGFLFGRYTYNQPWPSPRYQSLSTATGITYNTNFEDEPMIADGGVL